MEWRLIETSAKEEAELGAEPWSFDSKFHALLCWASAIIALPSSLDSFPCSLLLPPNLHSPNPPVPGLWPLLAPPCTCPLPGPIRNSFLLRCGGLTRVYILTSREKTSCEEGATQMRGLQTLENGAFQFLPDHTHIHCLPAWGLPKGCL